MLQIIITTNATVLYSNTCKMVSSVREMSFEKNLSLTTQVQLSRVIAQNAFGTKLGVFDGMGDIIGL